MPTFVNHTMIVPTFWAEGRIQHQSAGRQITVRRFGWSDESQAAAQISADARPTKARPAFSPAKSCRGATSNAPTTAPSASRSARKSSLDTPTSYSRATATVPSASTRPTSCLPTSTSIDWDSGGLFWPIIACPAHRRNCRRLDASLLAVGTGGCRVRLAGQLSDCRTVKPLA